MLFPTATSAAPLPASDPSANVTTYYPHVLCQGSGTEQDPYHHADGTCGVQTILNSAPANEGISIEFCARRFDFSATVSVTRHAVRFTCSAPGANVDPNGLTEGTVGGKIRFASTAFRVGNGGGRLSEIQFDNLYGWGGGKSTGSFIEVAYGGLDQPKFEKINVSNCKCGLLVTGAGSMDTPKIDRLNCLGTGYGIYYEGGPAYLWHITDCCLSDLDHSSIYFANGIDQAIISGNECVRAGNVSGPAVRLAGRGITFTANNVRDSGFTYLTGSYVPCDGVVVDASDSIVGGGQVVGSQGVGIKITGQRNKVYMVKFGGLLAGNQTDVATTNTAADTWIDQTGYINFTDAGVRTVINNTAKSAGDPNATAPWNAMDKGNYPGLRLYDTVNNVLYEYQSYYAGGRRIMA